MVLKSLWRRILPSRKPGESVELDPVAQIALRFLLNYGEQTRERILAEVNATRVASSADVEQALDRLLNAGLVESASREGGEAQATPPTGTKDRDRVLPLKRKREMPWTTVGGYSIPTDWVLITMFG